MSSVEVNHRPATVSQPASNLVAALMNRPWILGLILAVATIAVYYPVHGHPFVNYDDNDYVYDNPQTQAGLTWITVKWACTSTFAANWHPLTWLSHALDTDLFGSSAAGPHDVNVFFHVLDAVLLFWVLLRATGFPGRSFMVAALFALHPINVESVAWISERKTLLSTLFFLLALGAYGWYARQPRVSRYALVAVLFAVGLTAKPQIIIFPFALLLWDYWPLERMSLGKWSPAPTRAAFPERTLVWLVLEKVPLFCIAAASAAITIKAQHGARSWFPRSSRAGNAILSYGVYVWKAFWPTRLGPIYPHPGSSINWWHVVASAASLLVVTALVILGRRRRYLTMGWCWFLGALVPMLGIVQVGVQARADRYAYVSFLGLFIIICWSVSDWAERRRIPSLLLPGLCVAVLAVLALTARHQIDYWQNDETLWRHTLEITGPNWVAEDELATALAVHGRITEAMPHYYKAIAISPGDTSSNMAIAIYEQQHRNYDDALAHYKTVVKNENEKPKVLVMAYRGMAKSYRALGNTAQAAECEASAKRLER
ncbi:MAG: tetratricopeptide repeat protein [Candidatus Korobacteraceae bacterium]